MPHRTNLLATTSRSDDGNRRWQTIAIGFLLFWRICKLIGARRLYASRDVTREETFASGGRRPA